MKCPYQPICPTTMFWYKQKQDFIRQVCNTDEHQKCLHYQSLSALGIKKGDKEWQRIQLFIHQRKIMLIKHQQETRKGELVWKE